MIESMTSINTTITVPSIAPRQLVSVSINLPYLDMIYERVSPYITNELLSIGLSIAIYRAMRDGSVEEESEEVMDNDAYEELYLNEFVIRAIELEKDMYDRPVDLDIITQSESTYYGNIVRDLVAHIEKYFIEECRGSNVNQLEFLMGVLEAKEFIDVIRHAYDHPSGYLYLFLEA